MIALGHILVATDFSEPSDAALLCGRELATRFSATLHVLHVVQNLFIDTLGESSVGAKSHGIDMIVMGTHGRGALAHLVMGSVAERAVRLAPCPVLTIRCPERDFVQLDALTVGDH